MSDFASRSIARRASSSGPTLGTPAFMMSAAVFIAARLFDRLVGTQAHRNRRDHVAGDHRLGGADPVRRPRGRRGRGRGPRRRPPRTAPGRARAGPPSIPERTSPLPAVARAGAESALTATRSPSLTIVSSPLRTTTAAGGAGGLAGSRRAGGRRSARSRARAGGRARRRAASAPSPPGARRFAPSSPAKALSPSASITSGARDLAHDLAAPARPRRGRVRCPARARRRRPARRRAARAFAEAGARQPSPPGQPTDITSGSPASKTGSRSAGTATVA